MSYFGSRENLQNHGHGDDRVIQAEIMHVNNQEQTLQGHEGMRHSVPSPEINTAVPNLFLRILPEFSKLFEDRGSPRNPLHRPLTLEVDVYSQLET